MLASVNKVTTAILNSYYYGETDDDKNKPNTTQILSLNKSVNTISQSLK